MLLPSRSQLLLADLCLTISGLGYCTKMNGRNEATKYGSGNRKTACDEARLALSLHRISQPSQATDYCLIQLILALSHTDPQESKNSLVA